MEKIRFQKLDSNARKFAEAQLKQEKHLKPIPLSEAGEYFLEQALQDNPQVPGRSVVQGEVQSGEFD